MIRSKPVIGLVDGVRRIPLSPVIDFNVIDVAPFRMITSPTAPVGGESAVNTLAVSVFGSRFPFGVLPIPK